MKADNYEEVIRLTAMGAIKTIFAEHSLQELLTNRRNLQKKLQQYVDVRTDPFGIKIMNIGVQNLKIFVPDLERDLSIVAESSKKARANIINAQSNFESAKLFTEAAEEYAKNPVSFQLQYFDSLKFIATKTNSKMIMPQSIV